jgi:hypothetical protein
VTCKEIEVFLPLVAELSVLVRPEREDSRVAGEKHCMVFAKCYLRNRLAEIEAAGNAILPIILIRHLVPEILSKREADSLRCLDDGHSVVGFDLRALSVQHRHHQGWSRMDFYSLVLTFLL